MKFPSKTVLMVSAVILLLVLGFVFIYNPFSQVNVSIERVEFLVKNDGWKILRTIRVYLKNKGNDNVTINAVSVNGVSFSSWSSRWIIIYPGETKYIEIYYPWNGGEYTISIDTSQGRVEVKKKSPTLTKINVVFENYENKPLDEIASFELFFADGEVKPGEVRVLDENGVEVLNQMWGIVTYQSGYVKTAVISFPLEVPPGGLKSFTIVFGEESSYSNSSTPSLKIERFEGYTVIYNGVIKVRFNETEYYHGNIDYFGSEEVNFAKMYRPANSTRSGLSFFHGMIDAYFDDGNGKMYAYLMKTKMWIDSVGPLFAVYARRWNLKTEGYTYEFFAVPVNRPYMLYRAVVYVTHEFTVGPNAGKPAPGEADYRYYNPSGMGNMAIPQLSVWRALFFLTDTGDLYSPPYPGNDLWIKHPVAALRDYDEGVGIMLLGNDPANPLGYWHITLHKFPWYDWLGEVPSNDPAADLVFIAGIHERMLCYDGQDPNAEPYASERKVVPRGFVLLDEGTYSYLFAVRLILNEDAVTVLRYMRSVFGGEGLKISVSGG